MSILDQARDALRNPIAFPGGYGPVAIYLNSGERVCHQCCVDNWREIVSCTRNGYAWWKLEAVGIYWEGPAQKCCECGTSMTSEYGDPEETYNE